MKLIITIDGRNCSGKSTIIKFLQEELKKTYNIDIPYFSSGQYYRDFLMNKIPNEKVDDEVVNYINNIYKDNDLAIIDGRGVLFAIESMNNTELNRDKILISILVDVEIVIQIDRLLKRIKPGYTETLEEALERDTRDQSRCLKRYRKDIFDKSYYDIYINTSNITVEELLIKLIDKINFIVTEWVQQQNNSLQNSQETEDNNPIQNKNLIIKNKKIFNFFKQNKTRGDL